ncbi:MAG TPA: type II toxin-antitoxin system prevent-host-death family antitoxin [Anaerolineae bacterium]|nr:type II toxin-antitoxin system prevent-host-death family antitoxin [Anaerolineae bacterium]HPD41998.1 type II toxin-antitoxin system prevent-host-death family antitoxin [Anaerolineae bacterium]HRU95581.1 type II toxin-antitoxin system prevent-host-death family antitoxin [Anaerolineae bacterium]HXK43375.1 type II toxin-antitoxin system prevent-host-death family antitoxin [Anaerolineae bacterium]
MPISLKSSEAQQNFGLVLERALTESDVIIERYGAPKVAIVAYSRYQALLAAERELLLARLRQAAAESAARAAGLSDEEVEALIEEAREAVAHEAAAK